MNPMLISIVSNQLPIQEDDAENELGMDDEDYQEDGLHENLMNEQIVIMADFRKL